MFFDLMSYILNISNIFMVNDCKSCMFSYFMFIIKHNLAFICVDVESVHLDLVEMSFKSLHENLPKLVNKLINKNIFLKLYILCTGNETFIVTMMKF